MYLDTFKQKNCTSCFYFEPRNSLRKEFTITICGVCNHNFIEYMPKYVFKDDCVLWKPKKTE